MIGSKVDLHGPDGMSDRTGWRTYQVRNFEPAFTTKLLPKVLLTCTKSAAYYCGKLYTPLVLDFLPYAKSLSIKNFAVWLSQPNRLSSEPASHRPGAAQRPAKEPVIEDNYLRKSWAYRTMKENQP